MSNFLTLGVIRFSTGDFAISFLSILLEGVPFVLIGTMISGTVDAFLPPRVMERILPRSGVAAVLVSGLLGLVFPMCECGVVPVIRRLIGKGLPVSCALTYMLAAPVMNPIVIITTYMAFKNQEPLTVTCLRLSLAYMIAIVVGLITLRTPLGCILRENILKTLPKHKFGDVAWVLADAAEREALELRKSSAHAPLQPAHAHHEHGSPGRHHHDHSHEHHDHDHVHDEHCGHDHHHHEHESGPEHSHDVSALIHEHHHHDFHGFRAKMAHALQAGTQDFLDVTFYLIIGAAITSLFNTALKQSSLDVLGSTPVLSSFVLQAFAFVLSLCSSSDAFVAAPIFAFPLAAKLAFLVFGPMVDIKLLMLYSSVFKQRFIIVLCLGLFVSIGLICSSLQPLLPKTGTGSGTRQTPASKLESLQNANTRPLSP